jgi:hypothetical protein
MLERPEHSDIADLVLDDMDLQVLSDIRKFLNVFHTAQQIVSAEKTPTLSIVIPIYEQLISMLTDLKKHIPNLTHAINASIDKLKEYMEKARSTKMYVLAMCKSIFQTVVSIIFSFALVINPQIKLHWAETHWEAEKYATAQAWIEEAVQLLISYSCIY